MSDLFVDLLLLVLGATFAPIYIIAVLLVLQSERGLIKASIVVTTVLAMRLVQGVVFGFVFTPAVDAESAADLLVIGPTLLLVAGVVLLASGAKRLGKQSEGEARDGLPAWMSKLTRMSVLKVAGTAALLLLLPVRQWVFTLAAITSIQEAQPGLAAGVGLYLVYTLATQILVLPLILAPTLASQRSAAPLRSTKGWLQRHGGVTTMIVSFIFGAALLFRGITGLLAFNEM